MVRGGGGFDPSRRQVESNISHSTLLSVGVADLMPCEVFVSAAGFSFPKRKFLVSNAQGLVSDSQVLVSGARVLFF